VTRRSPKGQGRTLTEREEGLSDAKEWLRGQLGPKLMHAKGSGLGSLGCSWARRASFGLTGNFFFLSFSVSSHRPSIRSLYSVGRPIAGQIFRAPHLSGSIR
jgi:hypothetical protein